MSGISMTSPAAVPLEGDTISAGLTGVQTVVSYLFQEFGSLVTTIASQPLLLIPVGIFVCGGIIGLAKRLIGR